MNSKGVFPCQRVLVWLRALRLPFISASLLQVLLGAAIAYSESNSFDPLIFSMTLVGVSLIHLGANLLNDYFDSISGCDFLNREPTPLSGGSRVIQEGLITPQSILRVASILLACGSLLGLALNSFVPGNRVLILGAVGLLIAFFYTAGPVKLSYRGLGEVSVFISFGPLLVGGAYLCQTGEIGSMTLLVSVPPGLLVASILLVNEVLDAKSDKLAGKKTLVVVLGERRGYQLFLCVHLLAYLWIGLGTILGLYHTAALACLIPLIFSLKFLVLPLVINSRQALLNASRTAILAHIATGGLLALSFVT